MPLRKNAKSPLSISLWFLQVVIVLVLTSVVIWLCLKPKHPVYVITNVYVPALDKENSTPQSNNETMRNTLVIQLNFEICNPNKRIGIYYDEINITLYSNYAEVLGSNSLPGFYQGYKHTNFYEVTVNTGHQLLRKRITSSSTDMIMVQLETSVTYKIFQSKTKHHGMKFEAYIGIGSDGRISGDTEIKLQHKVKDD